MSRDAEPALGVEPARSGPDARSGPGAAPDDDRRALVASLDASSSPSPSSSATESVTPERAIELVGVGAFQVRLTALFTLANAADAIEVLSVGLMLPSVRADLGLSDERSGALASAAFAGAFVGSVAWGAWGDAFGRRPALLLAMSVNAGFALLSVVAPDFPSLLACRLLSGFGVAGTNAVVFATLPEFLPTESRGPYVVVLASGWMFGSAYAAALAWAVIPSTNGNWRLYALLSAVPAVACLLSLLPFAPESVRFLAVAGRAREAADVARRVAEKNGTLSRWPTNAVVEVRRWRRGNGGDERPTPADPSPGRFRRSHSSRGAAAPLRALLFAPTLRRRAAPLAFVWFALSFGWYGVALWLPTFFAYSAGDGGATDARTYADALLVALSNLPGNVASAFFVDWFGRRAALAGCMAAAALALVMAADGFGPGSEDEENGASSAEGSSSRGRARVAFLACACAFNALSVGGWNALDLATAESFPTLARSTALGALGAAGRLGSLAGTAAIAALAGRGAGRVALWVAAAAMLAGAFAAAVGTPFETRGRRLEDEEGEGDEEGGDGGEEETAAFFGGRGRDAGGDGAGGGDSAPRAYAHEYEYE